MHGTALEHYIGLSEREALQLALMRHRPVRVVCTDGRPVPHKSNDVAPDRINLVIESGLVAQATRG